MEKFPVTTYDPEKFEAFAKSMAEAAGIAQSIVNSFVRAFNQMFDQIKKFVNGRFDRMLYAANANPKWWHLYKHAKKYRTRKKYRRKLVNQLFRAMRYM